MKEPNTQPTNRVEELQTIWFRAGRENYGLALTDVMEIVNIPRITQVPNSPEYINGVINHHGNVIPVIDLACRFNIGSTNPQTQGKIIVIEIEDELVGIVAEEVDDVIRLSTSSIKPPPSTVSGIAAEYINGVARIDDGFLIFLNFTKSLAEGERNRS
jgi:purine-binding chemotaxis protein CheW